MCTLCAAASATLRRSSMYNPPLFITFYFQPGYYGEPEIECKTVGCRSDSECAEDHACRNGDCTPVCGPDGWPCGGQAVCKGVAHQPTCSCPPGLTGDPYVTCNRRECDDNSKCPPDQECINKICEDPCAIRDFCNPDEICSVENHQARCDCPLGTEGDRSGACVKGERYQQCFL
jgi:hypothetical protein